MYVTEVTLTSIRSFRKARLGLEIPRDDAPPGRCSNVTLIVGDNGAGKTTLLRAIALGALAPLMRAGSSGYVPFSLFRHATGERTPKEATVSAELDLHEQDGVEACVPSTLRILPTAGLVDRFAPTSKKETWASGMWQEKSPAFFLVGYGATRIVDTEARHGEASRAKKMILRYRRVAGLFEEGVSLTPLAVWLPAMRMENPGRYAQVVSLFQLLLAPHGTFVEQTHAGDEPEFRVGGSPLPFEALSDGFRAYIGWIGDLLYHLCMGAPRGAKLVEARGVVLVDEVDLHLHPEWQKHVIATLSSALPRVQFVLTSHSPLVVGSLHANNIRVIAEEEGVRGASVILPARQDPYGLSADQILTSGLFGLRTTRVAPVAQRLQATIAKAQRGDSKAGLTFLRMLTLGGAGEERPAPSPGADLARKKRRKAK